MSSSWICGAGPFVFPRNARTPILPTDGICCTCVVWYAGILNLLKLNSRKYGLKSKLRKTASVSLILWTSSFWNTRLKRERVIHSTRWEWLRLRFFSIYSITKISREVVIFCLSLKIPISLIRIINIQVKGWLFSGRCGFAIAKWSATWGEIWLVVWFTTGFWPGCPVPSVEIPWRRDPESS